MSKRLIIPALVLLLIGASAQAAEWKIDVPHSSMGFQVSHLVIAEVTGKFEKFSGTLEFDGQNLENGSVTMEIDVSSINTASEKRDGHLKSPDFFDAAKYPTITFVSKKVIKGEDNEFKVVGDLTMRGVTKEVTFDCVFKGTVEFMGITKAVFSAQTVVNRQDYGVSWSKTLDNGGLVAGDEVEINLDLEFDKVG